MRRPRERWHAHTMRIIGRRGPAALAAFALVAVLVASRPIAATAAAPTQSVIVSLDTSISLADRLELWSSALATSSGASEAEVVPFASGSGYAAMLDAAQIAALRAMPGVLAVTPNRVLEPAAAPQLEQTLAPAAWAEGWRGEGQTVVVIDTGADGTNANLTGKIAAEACFTPARGAGGDCPNGTTTQLGPGAAVPCTGRADCSHGTHVASTAVGAGPAVFGTAPGALAIAVQVFTSVKQADDRVITDEASLVRALEWVDAMRSTTSIAAVNLSLGGPPVATPCAASPALRAVIDRLTTAGIAIVASAGNDASASMLSFPACLAGVVSVGAEGQPGRTASFTNVATDLTLFAPGEGIEGAWSAPCCTKVVSGTSFAAPQVTAAFALLRQELGAGNGPGVVASRVALLRRTGDPVYSLTAGAWVSATALRIERALDPQFQSATPAVLARAAPPFGSVDAVTLDPRGLRVNGWALDGDTVAPVTMHVYVDGVFVATTRALATRPDVGAVYRGYGAARGFDLVLGVAPGDHEVCVYGLDLGAGPGNVLIACRRSTSGGLLGAIDASFGAAGTINASGWVIDATRVVPSVVQLVVDDVVVAQQVSAASRDDVGAVFAAYGPDHGYAMSAVATPGPHRVCILVGPALVGAAPRTLGCREVIVGTGPPFGIVDSTVGDAGRVVTQGWAIDPDSADPIEVLVDVDGVAVPHQADVTRLDLISAIPGYGARHGFRVDVAAAAGTHRVCVSALDNATHVATLLSCAQVDVN